MEKEQREEMVGNYNYSLLGQTKGSHCLGLGAAPLHTTTQHWHLLTLPSQGAMDTTPTYRDNVETLLNRRLTQFTSACTNPHTHTFAQTHRDKDMQTQAYIVMDACTHVSRHAQRNV